MSKYDAEEINQTKLDAHYKETPICPHCRIKMALNWKKDGCDNPNCPSHSRKVN